MASNRHLGRIVALQTLYEYEFRMQCGDTSTSLESVLSRNISRYQETIDDKQFIRSLVEGVNSTIDKLDATIQPIAPEWPVEQIARIDRSILRMALFELLNSKDVPPKVVINEAVELAKAFGGENSSKFVNGVLGTAYRQQEEGSQAGKSKKKPAKKAKKATKSKTATKSSSKTAAKKKTAAKPKTKSKSKPAAKKSAAKKSGK